MERNPCYDCSDRAIGCHGKCDKYKEWKAENDRLREAERKQRAIDSSLSFVGKKRYKRW